MAKDLTLTVARLRYTLRQRTLPSFIGAVGAMFSTRGGYFQPMNPPACCQPASWQEGA